MPSPKEFFSQTLAQALVANPQALASTGIASKKVAVELDGSNGGAWTLFFAADGSATLSSAAEAGADALIQASDKTFAGLMDGSVNVAAAVLFRKIKIKGDTALAAKVGQALQKIS